MLLYQILCTSFRIRAFAFESSKSVVFGYKLSFQRTVGDTGGKNTSDCKKAYGIPEGL